MSDLAPPGYLFAALLLLVAALAFAAAFSKNQRARRSLGLLALLVATLGALAYAITLPLGAAPSLAVFFGLFAVIRLMGLFDSPE